MVSMLSSAAAEPTSGRAPAPQALRHLDAKLNLVLRLVLLKGLRIGIRDDEFRPLQVLLDHVVDGIAAGAARHRTR